MDRAPRTNALNRVRMMRVEELKKELKCQKCNKIYSPNSKTFLHQLCQHHTCNSCLKYAIYGNAMCPVCGTETPITNTTLFQDILTTLKISREVEKYLRNKITNLQLEVASKHDDIKCCECGQNDSEQNTQLCSTCHDLNFEGVNDVKKYGICAGCAIKKHIRQGHQVVDFFPYLSAYNFSSKSPKIKSESEELKNAQDLLNNTLSDFNAVSSNVSESCDVLTGMARRSKSTNNQLKLFEQMKTFINESKSIHVVADSELKERTKFLQEILTKIKEWYNARIENCVDESETIKLEEPRTSDNNNSF